MARKRTVRALFDRVWELSGRWTASCKPLLTLATRGQGFEPGDMNNRLTASRKAFTPTPKPKATHFLAKAFAKLHPQADDTQSQAT